MASHTSSVLFTAHPCVTVASLDPCVTVVPDNVASNLTQRGHHAFPRTFEMVYAFYILCTLGLSVLELSDVVVNPTFSTLPYFDEVAFAYVVSKTFPNGIMGQP